MYHCLLFYPETFVRVEYECEQEDEKEVANSVTKRKTWPPTYYVMLDELTSVVSVQTHVSLCSKA